jgi:hypothetical protein
VHLHRAYVSRQPVVALDHDDYLVGQQRQPATQTLSPTMMYSGHVNLSMYWYNNLFVTGHFHIFLIMRMYVGYIASIDGFNFEKLLFKLFLKIC